MPSAPLHFVEYGEGTPVLALHGFTPDHRLMTGCLEPVFAQRAGYRRIYPDLPGMGHSPAPEWIASSDDVLTAVEAFVDEHIHEPFLLVGESYGGYLARAIANRRPDRVTGLALICPAGVAIDPAERTVPPRTVLVRDPQLIASLDPAEAADFTEVAVIESAETLRRFREDVGPGIALADEAALLRIRQRYELTRSPEGATPYRNPTLILTGRQDSVVGYADVYALLEHYPRATFAVLDRAGHGLQHEQPELFETLVGEWLDRLTP